MTLMNVFDETYLLIVYKKTEEWYIEWQLVTASGATSDKVRQQVTKTDNEWQEVVILANFHFFRIREELNH